jgi:hypothetical protein
MPVNEAIIDEIGSLRVLKASTKGKLGNALAGNFFYSATRVELFCFEEYQDRTLNRSALYMMKALPENVRAKHQMVRNLARLAYRHQLFSRQEVP